MRSYHLAVSPVAKPRQTRADKWKKRPCVMAYRSFADHLRLAARQVDFHLPPAGVSIIFYLPMPESWSGKKKQRMAGQGHTQKPDLDNLLKAVFDALLGDDSHIWALGRVEKRWAEVGHEGEIVVTVED